MRGASSPAASVLRSIAAVVLALVAVCRLSSGDGVRDKERAPQGGIEAETRRAGCGREGLDAALRGPRLGGIETQIRELRQEARTLQGRQ